MNYPVWDVAFGAGLLIATVAIIHVFVSHFAVGGGLFLVVTERKARRNGDTKLLDWLKFHSKFFVLVTVVFGVVTGVGIWFTIGLINPTATSDLIHIYVWGWAIEWVFFFTEISAALFYLYGWDKLDARVHQWFGWIYFIAAFASLVVINGIITFMLTSGSWVKNHQFWSGFFNPTYFPSLALRFAICLALAGVYALITASVQKDKALKARIVRWSALWIVPSLAMMPAFGWWYIHQIPSHVWASARGPMPTATDFAHYAVILLVVAFALALISLIKPARMHLAFSLLIALVALGTMGSFEFVRESVRLPYVIDNYLYANSIYASPVPGDGGFNLEKIKQAGVLKTAKWVKTRELTPENQVAVGREVFRVDCESCHTTDEYRGVKELLTLRQWDQAKTQTMLGVLYLMHNNVMPPFAGNNAEQAALAAFLYSLEPTRAREAGPPDGHTVFVHNCAMCHEPRKNDYLFKYLPKDPATAIKALEHLPNLFPLMPDLKLSAAERTALVQWVNTRRGIAAHAAGQGGN
ncbi:MAG: cytochrome c [Acidobacteriota bacterium]